MKEVNFKRCFINGKKAGVAEYDNGKCVILYFGCSLGVGAGEDAAQKLRSSCGTLHQFTNYIEIDEISTGSISAVIPGAVVVWEGSEEYTERVTAAVGSRGGKSKKPSESEARPSHSVAVSSDAFRVPAVDECEVLHALIKNMPAVIDDLNAWGVEYSNKALNGDSVVAPPNCIAQISAFLPSVVDAFAAYTTIIINAVNAHKEKQAAARESAQKAAAAAAAGKCLVTLPDGSSIEVAGTVHEQFTTACQLVKRGLNVYLYGPAGTGKTYLCQQIADALGLEFFSDQKVTNEYQLTGFVDSNGKYIETELYRAATRGGVYMLDEFDASDESAAVVLNSLLANNYITFPGVGRVVAHKDLHIIACGNTLGRGAVSEYTGRNCLDAATLDRFAVVSVNYSKEIELLKANGDTDFLKFIHAVRKAAESCDVSLLVTLRAIDNITKIKDCFTPSECLQMCLTKEFDKDQLNLISGSIKGSGVWFDAFKSLVA